MLCCVAQRCVCWLYPVMVCPLPYHTTHRVGVHMLFVWFSVFGGVCVAVDTGLLCLTVGGGGRPVLWVCIFGSESGLCIEWAIEHTFFCGTAFFVCGWLEQKVIALCWFMCWYFGGQVFSLFFFLQGVRIFFVLLFCWGCCSVTRSARVYNWLLQLHVPACAQGHMLEEGLLC